jgi:tetratricopeptide (TPR) repeat protein
MPPEVTGRVILPAPVRNVDAQLLPGYDVFTDFRLALALQSNPAATWFEEMRRAVRERPELAAQLGAVSEMDAAAFLERTTSTPLRSLTGAGSSGFNDQMLKAESSMGIGHYSEAVDRYEAAHMIDPTNPLPLLGKGHALLAQGTYRSAATALLAGIELADRYPGLAALLFRRLDLQTLMGGGEIVEIRRADLMKQLERREDPLLRFLLGYLEYHSGDQQHGLENLQRAAHDPRASMMIARYPRLLTEETPPEQPQRDQPQRGSDAPARGPLSKRPAQEPAEELVLPPRSE